MGRLQVVGQLAFVTLVVVVAAACEPSGPPALGEISGLHFTASGPLPGNPPPDVDVTVTDATKARAIYEATLALPEFPAGTFNCPGDPGVRYALDFLSGKDIAAKAVLNPAGCAEVMLTGSPLRQSLDPAYWATLAQDLGIDEATIYPYHRP